MPDWKNAADYAFMEQLGRWGWVWEFMRRNGQYQADFASAVAGAMFNDPPLLPGESQQEWRLRVMQGENETQVPVAEPLAVALARKWKMKPPIHDPALDTVPKYLERPPALVNWDNLSQYFSQEDDVAEQVSSPISPNPETALLAFSLEEPLAGQLARADDLLKELAANTAVAKPASIVKESFQRFCRLLDAKSAEASLKEQLATLSPYNELDNTVATGYKATKRRSEHLNRAQELCENPFLLLY